MKVIFKKRKIIENYERFFEVLYKEFDNEKDNSDLKSIICFYMIF